VRFFDRVQPRALIMMETEIWPNWLAIAATRRVPALLVNARLSARSARGYRRVRKLVAPLLSTLRLIACQTPAHAERFMELGVPRERVSVVGSVKFDQQLPADQAGRVAALAGRLGLGERLVWIAGSTHPGEEQMVLAAHEQVRARYPDACLLLVPRHPARAGAVAALLAGPFPGTPRLGDLVAAESATEPSMQQRPGSCPAPAAAPAVILVDTMGQLQTLYGLARVAFVGGSLVPRGGHNPIEPALCSVPVLMGPSRFNFEDVCAAFAAAGGLTEVHDAGSLAQRVCEYLADPDRAGRQGAAAAATVAAQRGASHRLVRLLRAEVAAAGGGAAQA
jgi:3-deoxy-D-manno-octulosonic-acid transferase